MGREKERCVYIPRERERERERGGVRTRSSEVRTDETAVASRGPKMQIRSEREIARGYKMT